MVWWVGTVLVVVVVVAALLFLEWRFYKVPLPRGREGGAPPKWTDKPVGTMGPLGRHSDLEKPHD
jgi:hypothetical protein